MGVVEGVTEFLPISSTGHLMITVEFLRLPATEFIKSFEIAIQLGAILAVVLMYWRVLFSSWELIKKLFVAFLPTAVIGLVMYKIVKQYFLGSTSVVLWALFLGGLFLLVFERVYQEKPEAQTDMAKITYRQAVFIGLFQSLAIVPGVSRAAATIIGGLMLGLKRRTIVEFSFLLAVPTMAAATGLDLIKNAQAFSLDQFWFLAVGFITAFVTAWFSIKFLLGFIQKHTFQAFAVYRIVAAIIFWLILYA